MVLTLLSPVDLIRCEGVCQSWRDGIRLWMGQVGIQLHYPYSCEMQDCIRKDLLPHQVFKLFACQEHALKLGEPTSVRKFADAYHFALAGDFVVWAEERGSQIWWQRLPSTGGDGNASETRVVDLSAWAPESQPASTDAIRLSLDAIRLNVDGFLLARVRLGPSNFLTRSFCDVVYSLQTDELVWRHVHKDAPRVERPRLTPMIIGRDRFYFAHPTANKGYDLVAFTLPKGDRLYQTPLIAKLEPDDEDDGRLLKRPAVDLINFAGQDELLIQFNSDRLVRLPSTRVQASGSFSIINGADGQVMQKFAYGGLGRPKLAKSTSKSSFTLASLAPSWETQRPLCAVTVQTFSRQSDGSFLRTFVRIVSLESLSLHYGSVAIHPRTLQAFSVKAGTHGPNALTLVPDDCQEMQKHWPDLTVDEFYRVAETRAFTLPPRKRDKSSSSSSTTRATVAVEEIVFSPAAREEYLTGFHKRKVQRTKAAQEAARKKEREEKIRQRKRIRDERTHELEEHAEYVDEDKYTSVVVEEMDVSREGLRRKADGDGAEEQGQDGQPAKSTQDGKAKSTQDGKGTASSKPASKHGQRRDGALKAKKKRKKFRYESKAERKVTREKERSKNRQQAKARKTK
ncbi:hypothetical protein DV735_g795, partial [Chaetothyriales sp. CBS 134920]